MASELHGWKPDWHQYVAFQVLSREQTVLARCGWMASSLLLVVVLTFVSVGILQGIDEGSCEFSSHCFSGYWCSNSAGRCERCFEQFVGHCPAHGDSLAFLESPVESHPARLRTAHRNVATLHQVVQSDVELPLPEGFSGEKKDFSMMCDGCYSENRGREVAYMEVARSHIQSMRRSDWATVSVATAIVVLSVLKEWRDTQLLELTWQSQRGDLGFGWQSAMWILTSFRRFAFLPALVFCVPTLIITTGGNALRVCMNTVAVLFVLELDTLMVRLVMKEDELPELHQQVHVALTKRAHEGSLWLERVSFLVIYAGIFNQLVAPLWASTMTDLLTVFYVLPFAFLFVGLLNAALIPSESTTCVALCSAFAKWSVGFVWLLLNIGFEDGQFYFTWSDRLTDWSPGWLSRVG